MHHVQPVQVIDSLGGLTEEECCLRLAEGLLAVLVVEKVAVLCVFDDHVDFVIVAQGVPQRDGVRVVEVGMESYLPLDQFELHLGGHVLEVYLFEGEGTILMA